MQKFVSLLLAIAAIIALTASKPFRGHLYDYKGNPIKNAKAYVHDEKKHVKTNKSGLFVLENVDPTDTIYIKWRGHVYDIPVDSNIGISVKFDREPMSGSKGEYVDMGIMGSMRAGNYTGRIQRHITSATALGILSMQAWKEGEPDPTLETRSHPFRGFLYDYKSKPIKNAKVYVHDPKEYVKTDNNGRFLIYGVMPTDTVYVKWKGDIYDIPVDGNKGISMKFEKDYPRRKGYVNTGKGIIDARTYNGPLDVRTGEQLAAMGTPDLMQALKGVAGVNVFFESDGTEHISIRNGGDPLWIIDGVEMVEFPDITVMEIERVEILKDGAGYGSRAMGGVIVITTKGTELFEPDK